MKTLKRLAVSLLIIAMLLSTVACGKGLDDPLASGSDSDLYADGGSNNNSSSKETIEHIEGNGTISKIDFSRYTIVATKINARALEAANDLSKRLSNKGFSIKVNQRSVYEIIIGNNTATETKSALDQLSKSDKDYLIQFSGTKIIIVAKNDLILPEACDMFFETYIKNMKNNTLEVKDGATTLGVSKNFTTIAYDGIAQYEIVLGNVSADVKARVTELAAFIKTKCGVSSVKSDAKYNKSKNQILIGPAEFSETSSSIKSLSDDKGIVTKVGNKIVIAGKDDTSTIFAIDAFTQMLEDADESNTKKGNYAISVTKSIIDTQCVSLDSIPKFTGATYSTTYPSGNGIEQLYYTNADPSKINAYVTQLADLGYRKVEDNSINNNRFVTCYGKNGIVHISYLNHNKSVSVILDSLNGSVYKASEPTYTKVTDQALAVMSIDYSKLSDKSDASGMSYIITLEDGRYIIIDGGYNKNKGTNDHKIIYNYLKDNNKRKDGKIVIAAWIFTHDHSDHHGVFTPFCQDYSSKVELQYYIQNFGDKSNYKQQPSGWLNDGIPNTLIAEYFKDAKKIVPHTGQKITFCNTTFEIISTQESHVPNKIEWVNDASIILRMNSNGVKTLFLADAEAQTTKLLLNMYGSTLKSDIMQIAHHGYSGGSTTLYQNVDPSWTLWPTNQTCFEERTTGGGIGNAQSQNRWARNNSICYVGDGDIEILKFVGGTSKISVSTCAPNYN